MDMGLVAVWIIGLAVMAIRHPVTITVVPLSLRICPAFVAVVLLPLRICPAFVAAVPVTDRNSDAAA